MRLLVVTNDFPPKPGGIQMYLQNFVDAYPDPVLVYAPADDNAAPDEEGVVRGSSTYMLPTTAVLDDIVARTSDFAPDAVMFGAPHPLPQLGAKLREALGVPFAVLNHGAEVTLPAAAPGTRQLLRRSLRAADVRFAVSRFTAGRVERLTGLPTHFLGAGVEIDTFTPAVRTPNPKPVVGCVSRFVPRKGQDRLLRAVAQSGLDVEVLLVGKGRTEGSLRKLADELGVDATFAVDVPWSELPDLYRRMDVFCMPTSSRWGGLEVEGLGLVFLEAAACGIPVLAGDSGGSPETIIPGETGYVVSSVDDIIEGLELLLGDPDRASEMGMAGRRFVEREFTWQKVIERLYGGFSAHIG